MGDEIVYFIIVGAGVDAARIEAAFAAHGDDGGYDRIEGEIGFEADDAVIGVVVFNGEGEFLFG